MTSTTTILKYILADSIATVEQQVFKRKAKLATIADWEYIDKLNTLKTFTFSIPNDEYHRANALIERKAFVPFLIPFNGIVSGRSKDESLITLTVSEFAYHLTRRIFRVDGEEEVTYTTDKWYDSDWKYRRLITVNPDDVETFQSSITLRINVTDLGFKNHAKSDGFDFRVTAKDGTTIINHERISWNPSTGALDLYFEAATVSNSGVTKFYIYYGNPAASDGSTDITDVDPSIPLTLHPQEQYQMQTDEIAQQILDSANTDMPSDVVWTLGEGIPTTNVVGTFKWKTHFDALQGLGELIGKDVWFDNKLFKVFIGTKGKTLISEKVDIHITTKPSVDTAEDFANNINVLGKKDDGTGLNIEGSSTTSTLLRYNYEKVVSDNQLRLQGEVDNIAANLLSEFQKLTPKVNGEVPYTQFVRLNLESGDIFTISQPNKDLNGSFRIMDLSVSQNKVKLKLEDIQTGIIRTRSLSLSDVIEGILNKLQNQVIE